MTAGSIPERVGATADALTGSFTPIVTPFRHGEVDLAAYHRLVERQVVEGSHGVVVNGTTAEPSVLSVAERNELVAVAVDAVRGRIPVVAATGSQSLAETIELTTSAQESGADAVLVVTPYYIKPPQRGMAEYFAQVGQHTDLPILIYHIPGRAGVAMDVRTVEAIKAKVPHLVGMKHAQNDLEYATAVLVALGPDFRLFVGLEALSFPLLAIGASGLMNAVGNIVPGRVAALCDAVAAGDLVGARACHYELDELNRAVFWDTNPIPIKYLMMRLGLLGDNEHRLPMAPATPEVARRLDALLERLDLS